MKHYLNLLDRILKEGVEKDDRTGTGTIGVHGHLMRFDLQEGFPLLTTKKLYVRAIIHELLWFIAGDTNIKYLNDNKVTIWDEWADEDGDLGPVYGYQWRSWSAADGKHIDQLKNVVDSLTNNRNSRRHIISAWNVGDLDYMALPPCHLLFQFHTRYDKKTGKWYLDLEMYQRSCDTFLGVPFNIASYAMFLIMMAQVCGYEVGEFIWVGGDVHIYKNHIEQCKLQLTRKPRKLPVMKLNPDVKSIFDFKFEDFTLEGYDPHPRIKGDISV